MKKIIEVLLSTVFLFTIISFSPVLNEKVDAATSGIYTYSVYGGKATITGTSASGDIIIPSTLGGYPVTSIGNYAFYYCSSLTSVTIPSGVTSIRDGAFSDCRSLTSVTIPSSVTSVGESAFYNCSSLTSVTIPNSVTSIGNYAFSYCSSLTSVTIPSSVTRIGYNEFTGCEKLIEINVDNNNQYYSSIDGILFNKNKSTLIQSPEGNARSVYTIPSSVTSIGDYSFYNCSSLTTVTIPNGVTSIGNSAFYDCRSLTTVTIPSSVTSIGDRAFSDCNSLTSVTIPSSVTSISDSSFSGCSSLTSVTIPSCVTSIGDYAFSGCSSLTSVAIPSCVTSIGDYAFRDCSSLTSVTIPSSVTSIVGAFSGCSSLTSVTIPDSVTSIGYCAFSGCSNLTSITIPSSVASIGDYAFSDCSSLTTVAIPSSVASIGERAFYNCAKLTQINVDNNNQYYSSIDGILFNKNKSTLIQSPEGNPRSVYTIPSSVTSIGNFAFYNCISLTSVTIPNSVTSIGSYAFSGCLALLSAIFTGNAPINFGHDVFTNVNSNFSIYYCAEASGWTSPLWMGYPAYTFAFSTVSFDTNALSDPVTNMPPTDLRVVKGFYILANLIPERIGYTFVGWATTSDGDVITNNTVNITENLTVIYAIWKKTPYALSFDANTTDTVTSMPASLVLNELQTYAITDFALSTPVRSGYNFIGWSTDGTSATVVTSITPTANITLKALWERITYTLSFDANTTDTVTSMPASLVLNALQTYSISDFGLSLPVTNRYIFKGWSLDGTTLVTMVTPSADLILKAIWDVKESSVSFHANGALGTPPSDFTILSTETLVLPSQEGLYKQGYQFMGWGDTPDSTDPTTDTFLIENKTYYAIWNFIWLGKTIIEGDRNGVLNTSIIENIYFALPSEVSYYNAMIRYPADLIFKAVTAKDFKYVYASTPIQDHENTGYMLLNISAQYSDSELTPAEAIMNPYELTFQISTDSKIELIRIDAVNNPEYLNAVDWNGNVVTFTDVVSQIFEVHPKLAESVLIHGNDSISGEMQYSAEILPSFTTNKNVEWTVSDSNIATIDQNGVLKPIKNGSVTITVRTLDGSNLTTQKTVTTSGMKAKINTVTSSIGYWDSTFNPNVNNYIIYVPLNTTNIGFTMNFNGGILVCEGYGMFFNNISKTLQTNLTSQTFKFARSNVTSYDDSVYTITIIKTDDFVTENGNILKKYIGSDAGIIIPSNITTISDYAFTSPNITKVTITDTVTTIGDHAFDGCDNIIIYCNTNSAAHLFAQKNAINFILLDSVKLFLGDANNDRSVTAFDAVVVLQLVAGISSASENTNLVCDVNGDGNVTAFDAVLILQNVAGMSTGFPIGDYLT